MANVAVDAPAPTVTEPGTWATAVLVLCNEIVSALGVAALSVT